MDSGDWPGLHMDSTWNLWGRVKSSKFSRDNCKFYDAYHTLINGEHILLLEIKISKSWMNQNDENLSELELNGFKIFLKLSNRQPE